MESAHCICPACNRVLADVLPRSVDMGKTLHLKFFVICASLVLLALFGLITDTGALTNRYMYCRSLESCDDSIQT